MTTHPVSRAGIAKIDQLAEKLRQRGGSVPLLRKTYEIFYNASALVMGLSFIMFFLCKISKSIHCSEYEPNLKVSRAY